MKKSVPLHRFNKAIDCLTKKLNKKMKKLVFMFVAMAAVSFASCGGSQKEGAAADSIPADSQSVEAPAEVNDSTNDSTNVAGPDSTNTEAAPAPEA